MENIESLITMFKEDKVTTYVAERELSKYLGDRCSVKIVEIRNHDVNKSFCFFALPEIRVEGFSVLFIVDKNAITQFYTEEEVRVICDRLKADFQKILSKYNSFIGSYSTRDLSKNEILGFLLNLYSSYSGAFAIGEKNATPNIDEVLKLADKFSLGQGTAEDVERLQILDMISPEVIEYCEK